MKAIFKGAATRAGGGVGRCAITPEYWKPEVFKPPVEKEFKPEGLINEQLVEKITVRVIEALKQHGASK